MAQKIEETEEPLANRFKEVRVEPKHSAVGWAKVRQDGSGLVTFNCGLMTSPNIEVLGDSPQTRTFRLVGDILLSFRITSIGFPDDASHTFRVKFKKNSGRFQIDGTTQFFEEPKPDYVLLLAENKIMFGWKTDVNIRITEATS